MSYLLRYFKSRFFLKTISFIILTLVILIWLIFKSFDLFTLHNKTITVPNLNGLTVTQAKVLLGKLNLNLEVIDSTKYNPRKPRFSIVEQNPSANRFVKKERKIYVVINPSNYKKVEIPNVIQITLRNARSKLISVGLRPGKVKYVRNIGKDMVLEIYHKGKKVEQGTMLTETSVIDMVCGNGKR